MEDDLPSLGVELVVRERGFALHCERTDWLRACLVAIGFRARVDGRSLVVETLERDALVRGVRSALAPKAVLFDLDGVLADIANRTPITAVDDLQAIAASRSVGVVTTCPMRLAESVLERHGFLAHIGAVIGSDHGPCKPDSFPVRLALQELGKDAAWMLGDNPSDVTAARHAGVIPFAIQPRGIGSESHADRLRAAGAVQLVEDVAALGALLPG